MARGRRKVTPVSARIAEALERTTVGKREIARRVWGNPDRFRDLGRYAKAGGPVPRVSTAVKLAQAMDDLELPPDAFVADPDQPLVAIAEELEELRGLVEGLSPGVGDDVRSELAALRDDLGRVLGLLEPRSRTPEAAAESGGSRR